MRLKLYLRDVQSPQFLANLKLQAVELKTRSEVNTHTVLTAILVQLTEAVKFSHSCYHWSAPQIFSLLKTTDAWRPQEARALLQQTFSYKRGSVLFFSVFNVMFVNKKIKKELRYLRRCSGWWKCKMVAVVIWQGLGVTSKYWCTHSIVCTRLKAGCWCWSIGRWKSLL